MAVLDTIRHVVNSHRLVIAVAILVVIFAAVFGIWRSQRSPEHNNADRPQRDSYYDEQTNDIVMQDPGQVPPVTTPDGRTLVRLRFTQSSQNVIQCLEKFTPAEKKNLEERLAGAPANERNNIVRDATAGLLVRAPANDAPWVPADSAEGKALLQPR